MTRPAEANLKADYPPASELVRPFMISGAGHDENTDPAAIQAAKAAFVSAQGAALLEVIDPALLQTFLRLIRVAEFTPQTVKGLGEREVETRDTVGRAVRLALARPGLLRWLEEVTGCGPLASVQGQVVRMRNGGGLTWHNDSGYHIRRLAVVMNLSENAYAGGRFELREADSRRPLMAYDHVHAGSITIFRIGKGLQHQLTPVTAGARTVFAGWFLRPLAEGETAPDRH